MSDPINTLSQKKIGAEFLQQWVGDVFQKLGVVPEVAEITAQSLVDADLSGIGTHGVVRVPIYVKRIKMGLINPAPEIQTLPVGAAAVKLNGDNGLGQWVGYRAMLQACELAETCGIGMVLAHHSNHFGTAGWFARQAAKRGYAALIWSQAESLVVPFGGTRRFFGTNPFCMSVPRGEGESITLDMATSAVPFGKIEMAKVGSGKIPGDWAVDAEGKSTTDPHLVHALQPMAGPKGSGLAMLIDLLSGGLAGEACGPRIHRMYDDFENEHGLVHTFIAIKANAFSVAGGSLQSSIQNMVGDLNEQKPADGFSEVLLPGELESRQVKKQHASGLPLSAGLLESLAKVGEEIGVAFPV